MSFPTNSVSFLLVNVWVKAVEQHAHHSIKDGHFAPQLHSRLSKALAPLFSSLKKKIKQGELGFRNKMRILKCLGEPQWVCPCHAPVAERSLGSCERVRNKEHMVCGKERVTEKEKGKEKRQREIF